MPSIATANDVRIGGTSLATEVWLGATRVWQRTVWTPLLISGLRVWLDASDAATVTLNGSNVSQLSDKSGNNNHAKQTSASVQPVYSASGINGKGCLLYNLVGHRLQFQSPLLIEENMIVASVWQRATSGIQTIDLGRNALNSQPFGIWWGSTNFINSSLGIAGTSPIYGNSTASGDFISFAKRGSLNASISRNGAMFGTQQAAPPLSGQLDFVGYRPGANQTHTGLWAETIVASDNSTATQYKIEGYLAHKWGISLPAGHLYHLNPP
jgi:hypothetical protein